MCAVEFEPVKPWQRHCSDRCRKTAYERATRLTRTLRRRVTRRIARLEWMRDHFVSGLRDRDDAQTPASASTPATPAPPRSTTQRDLRKVAWKRLPRDYRRYWDDREPDRVAAALGWPSRGQLLREWRKFWNRQIREAR